MIRWARRATTFTDLWHFTDPAHDRLTERLYECLVPVLEGAARR